MLETSDVPTRPRISWRRRLWAVGPLVPAILAFRCVNPSMSDDALSIVEFAPWVPTTLAVVATVWFAALAIAGLVTKGRRGPGIVALLVVAGLGVPPAMCLSGLSGRFGWRPYLGDDARPVEARAADGAVWTVFCVTWLEGNYAFARTAVRGPLRTQWDVPARLPGLDGAAHVVRPAGLDPTARLVVRNGCVALIGANGTCQAAVRADGTPLVGAVWNPSWIGTRRPVDEDRAPFFLVEPGDALVEADVAALEAEIAEVASDTGDRVWRRDSLPSDAGLLIALGSPHAGIRDAAARLVRAGGETLYPNAMARLRR